jgi:phosphatidylserine/phosphatidylglycerophosphate/cardiolipin synthase-like enzyme
MKRFPFPLVLLFALLFGSSPAHADESINCKVKGFFPGTSKIGEALSQELKQAKKEVLIALYGFNNPALAEDLMKLAQRGVKVRVKIDTAKGAEKKESKLMATLKAAGVSVQAVAADGRNHNKFAVVDDATVITGSYNWTIKAESNFENLLVLNCPELAKRYTEEWDGIR